MLQHRFRSLYASQPSLALYVPVQLLVIASNLQPAQSRPDNAQADQDMLHDAS